MSVVIKTRKTINIIVNLQIEGLHHWPECPIEEVSYLKDLHRHTFYITCKKEVSHADRDVEIIQFKHKLIDSINRSYYDSNFKCLNFGRMSCENIADILFDVFDLSYCSVLEDNEVGAEIFKK